MKSFSFLFGFCLLIFLFAVVPSGCLDSADSNDDSIPHFITSANNIYSENGELFVETYTLLKDPKNQTFLKNEIKVNRTGNTVHLTLPVKEKKFTESDDFGHERVNVSIGKISEYDSSGDFIVLVNENPSDINSVRFSVEDENLYKYRPADLENGKFKLDGDEIIHIVTVALFDSTSSVDRSRISDPGKFDENNSYSIYLPVKTAEGGHSVTDRRSTVRFAIGNQKELPDGIYFVSVNDGDLSFEIQNQTLMNETEFETIWCFGD